MTNFTLVNNYYKYIYIISKDIIKNPLN